MRKVLEHALAARRRSRRVELKPSFDPQSDEDWLEVLKDIAAIANSGGGVMLFDDLAGLDEAAFAQRLGRQTDGTLPELELVSAEHEGRTVRALVIKEPSTPIVFRDGKLLFRHGTKSEPATTADLAAAIERRMDALRKSWLTSVRKVIRAPGAVLSSEVRDSSSPDATPIRIVDDPRATTVRLIDYDRTHPYRQKELLAALRERLPGFVLNQFDLLSVRHVHKTDENHEFSHQPMFGSRQYSEKFVSWLAEQTKRDPQFFETARAAYLKERRRA